MIEVSTAPRGNWQRTAHTKNGSSSCDLATVSVSLSKTGITTTSNSSAGGSIKWNSNVQSQALRESRAPMQTFIRMIMSARKKIGPYVYIWTVRLYDVRSIMNCRPCLQLTSVPAGRLLTPKECSTPTIRAFNRDRRVHRTVKSQGITPWRLSRKGLRGYH